VLEKKNLNYAWFDTNTNTMNRAQFALPKNTTSLMEDYIEQGNSLVGFTLSYKSFFQQFSIDEAQGHYFIRWNTTILWNDRGDAGKAVEFAKEQFVWISSPEIQQMYWNQPKELRIECQKRINFFVKFLHEKGGQGWDGKLHFILRDIRNLAYLCIK
jgi:hypothetical protein